MIETNLRGAYQKFCIDPLLRLKNFQKISPAAITGGAFLAGIGVLPLLAFGFTWTALLSMLISGFLDTLDGSVARLQGSSSPKGAAIDIISDRAVELSILLGLFFIDPEARALPVLLMLGSVFLCVTSFLIVGVFTPNQSEKSFHYNPGLIERAEAFIFFAAMILFPSAFFFLSYLFTFLVFLTAFIRMIQFVKAF